ncbi:hypothetical protein CANARDRAFT_9808 [[Candida] arabinofermentans NRRL YB-2248]|uniref:Phospholipid:diacylglycerol acyltransferase n=1 Tax=[Candida] arabinofermentans NRRL YB-2248 TaxID=983967 RepID=A0A1E4SUN6_9ASCO|nr:hypothetical protein CANARDRAFT_9808 [[Candida] arabinofermentans NRRL YB-2248]
MPPKLRKSSRLTKSSSTKDNDDGTSITSSAAKIGSTVENVIENESSITEVDVDDENVNDKVSKANDIIQQKKERSRAKALIKTKRFMFVFGVLFGTLTALYLGSRTMGKSDIFPELDNLLKFDSMSGYFEDWKDVLPSGIQRMLEETDGEELHNPSESFAIGKLLKREGFKAEHPVILVPGVISTGIESWGLEGTEDCPSEPHFRKRMWGSFYMLRTMFLDKACWLKHVMLDFETGLDPPGIILRAAQGFEAADFFMAGYWIWNKILQNLAVIGYGPGNMFSASYDWRLSYLDLERRDGYFTKLKSQIETTLHITGKKSMLAGHSMGAQVIFYFLKWVEAEGEHFGNGGPNWVNDHIDSFVDISGCLLGTPKAIVALLSGEMKDTVQLNTLAVQGLEKFFSRRERMDMLKSFGGIASMLPKGGELIWGDLNGAPDDNFAIDKDPNETLGNFIRFTEEVGEYSKKNLSMQDSIDFLLDQGPNWFTRRTQEHYSHGVAKTKKELIENEKQFNKWVNPLEVPLPYAPDLKIYAFYGVGIPTERAYTYREEKDKEVSRLNVSIDIDSKDSVMTSNGDGTISLMTHSIVHKWAQEGDNMFNPANCKVTIVEIKHDPDKFDIRGGSKTADHVDILGSAELNELLLRVASGQGDSIENTYITDLKETVANMDF